MRIVGGHQAQRVASPAVAAPDLVVDPVFGVSYRFWRTADEDGGEVQHVEMRVDPGGGVPPHVHPRMEERFTVRAGTLELLGGREWTATGPGETVVVAPGTRHAFRNRGADVVHAVCAARPPTTLQAFLEDAAGLSRAGLVMRPGLPTPRGLLHAAVFALAYREDTVLLFPAPPPAVQRVLFPPLARLGERRGLRAGRFARL